MMRAHPTKGPWEIEEALGLIKTPEGVWIARMQGAMTNLAVAADARLIALAPEMFEFLLGVADYDDEWNMTDLGNVDYCEWLRDKARQLVGKVEGGQEG